MKIKTSRIKPSQDNQLFPEHLADLHASGLSDKTIREAGLYSADRNGIKRLMGWVHKKVKSALVFPYGGGFVRIKLFPSFINDDGNTVKYLQRKGTPPRLYVPRLAAPYLQDPKLLLYVTEGEKKTLCLCQHGLPCVGVGGVWSWFSKGRPIPDLDRIAWRGRRVVLIGDADVWLPKRKDLRLAIYALCKEVEARGARGDLIILPQEVEL